MTSDANALPPPESTRSTSALTASSTRAWRISSAVESPPIAPGGCVPSRIVPAATMTATLLGDAAGGVSVAQSRHVVLERHFRVVIAPHLAGRVLADGVADALAHRIARQQLVDEPVVDRELCRVAAGLLEQRHDVVGVLLERRRGQLARSVTSV